MTQPPTRSASSGLVRVTVASGSRRIDLVLPGAVPVAELAPELARGVGLLDAATVHGGYHLVAPDGRRLSAEAGLTLQGIEDGALLTVGAGVDDEPPRVYDDVVEAMADAVERDLRPWSPAAGRRTALLAAAGLLLVGAIALLLQRGSEVGTLAAGVVAALLTVAGVTLSRVQREREAAVCLAWLGVVYAGVAAAMALSDRALVDPLTLGACGGGVLAAGLVGLVGLAVGRTLLIPAVVVGGVFAAGGLVLDATGIDEVAEAFTVLLVLVVIAGSLLPWLALSSTRTSAEHLRPVHDFGGPAHPGSAHPGSVAGHSTAAHSTAAHSTTAPGTVGLGAEPTVAAEQVRQDAQIGHELLLGVSVTVGVLLVLVAPMAVSLGLAGTLVVVGAAAVLMLRTRQYRAGSQVLVGLASGVLALLTAAGSVLVMHPDWRPTLAVVLAGAGAVLLASTLVPRTTSLRRGRLADVAEAAALVALLPLTVVALGLVG